MEKLLFISFLGSTQQASWHACEEQSFEKTNIEGCFHACCTFHRSKRHKSILDGSISLIEVEFFEISLQLLNLILDFSDSLVSFVLKIARFLISLLVGQTLSFCDLLLNFDQSIVRLEILLSKMYIHDVLRRIIFIFVEHRIDLLRFFLDDFSQMHQ